MILATKDDVEKILVQLRQIKSQLEDPGYHLETIKRLFETCPVTMYRDKWNGCKDCPCVSHGLGICEKPASMFQKFKQQENRGVCILLIDEMMHAFSIL